MSDNCRQHYRLATNEPLQKTPKGPHPGYAKGGKVASKTQSRRLAAQKGGRMYRSGGRGC